MKRILKRILIILGILIGVVVVLAVGLFGYLTITEYRPADVETLQVSTVAEPSHTFSGDSFRVLSWNVGYGALGKDSDFFMDGGKQSRPGTEASIRSAMEGIRNTIKSLDKTPDFCFLQEVDEDSQRSYWQNEVEFFSAFDQYGSAYYASAFAYNYKCNYVPIPFPPLGKIQSGLLTLSGSEIAEATRVSLPCPFKWPVSTANLKRCLLVSRVPLEGTDKQLVLVNLHLEAYDSGEGKIEQTRKLLSLLTEEYEKGNYVVAGGDWNQVFPGSETRYPNTHRDLWAPGVLVEDDLAAGWQLVWDDSVPTCRLLNQPYDPSDTANTQYYVIDGFLISPNLSVNSVQTLDEGFANSDHNPVVLDLQFGE